MNDMWWQVTVWTMSGCPMGYVWHLVILMVIIFGGGAAIGIPLGNDFYETCFKPQMDRDFEEFEKKMDAITEDGVARLNKLVDDAMRRRG